MIKTPHHWLTEIKTYTPGLSIEEIKKKYSLKTVYKLASNENPLPPPKGLLQVLKKKLTTVHRYPSYIRPVVEAASQYYKVEANQLVFGNGSSELIDKLMQTYGETGSAVLISEKSFPLYAVCAQAHRLRVFKAPMEKNLKVNTREMLSLLQKNNIRMAFISNPNNPTGSYITHSELESFLVATENKNMLVVSDEAYWEYVRATDFPNGLSLMRKYPHLVLLRSMSKVMGLAGLRAGVMLANPSVTEMVKKVICPFNVNTLAAHAMLYCMSDSAFKKYLQDSKQLVWKGLDYFYNGLKKADLHFYPSQGNFVLFSAGRAGTFPVFLKKGLILRPLNEPGLENYLRMSVGLEYENEKAMELIQEIC